MKRALTSNGIYGVIASNLLGTNFVDATTNPGQIYYYVVSAVNANGESLNSSPASLLVTLPSLTGHFNQPASHIVLAGDSGRISSLQRLQSHAARQLAAATNAVTQQGANLIVTTPLSSIGDQYYRLTLPNP